MCATCLLVSTLTLFMPAPQATNGVPTPVPEVGYSQVSTSTVAKDTQAAIAAMLKELPNSADMRVLREGLNALYAQLATVKNDTEAKNLIDDSLRSLSERLKAEPNSDKISEILMGMLVEEDSEPATKSLGFKMLQRLNYSKIDLKDKGNSWGWFH